MIGIITAWRELTLTGCEFAQPVISQTIKKVSKCTCFDPTVHILFICS